MYAVYLLRSNDGRRSYCGITTDVNRRVRQHNGELRGGAKACRARRPWTVAFSTARVLTRSDALRLEASVKRRRGLDERRKRLAAFNPSC